MAAEIPVIDMEGFPKQLPKLLKACEEWGCFRVVNHNIPSELLLGMKSVARSLLDLPPEIKNWNTDIISGSGYVPPDSSNPHFEALGLYDIGLSEAVQAFCSQLHSSPQQSDTINSYTQGIVKLTMDLAYKIAECIGLHCNSWKEWPCQLWINKYSFTEETIGSLGVRMHTDCGFLTILQEDECVGGLEVVDQTGSLLAVDPFPGSLFVNLGDVAKVWSNGRFCNVKHRVQCKEAATRITMATFMLGPTKEAVEAPPELVDSNHPRLYHPFSYEEYRKVRLSSGQRAGEILALYAAQQP